MKLSYYPGCSLTGTAREYDESIRDVARLLGIDLVEIEDWSCCGASSAHMTDHRLSVELAARNLDLAAPAGLDVLVPCAACFQRLKAADSAMREDPKRWGRADYTPAFQILHITTLLSRPEILDRIREGAQRTLEGMRLACYYGCLSLRPPAITGAVEYEDPRGLDVTVEALGAESVRWSHKTECCSGSLSLVRPDIARRLVGEIAAAAVHAGAQALVTDCPMCQANMESRQLDLAAGETQTLPVFFSTELIAAAMEDEVDVGRWKKHLIAPRGLEQLGL
jgi:heterodisulfide reductase subunit B